MKARDPVCGMTIEQEKAAAKTAFKGHTYFFCSRSCKEKFDKDPQQYTPDAPASGVRTPHRPSRRKSPPCPDCGRELMQEEPYLHASRSQWTCPVHPQMVRDAPGSCQICGTALEPKTITAEAENPELVSMKRRFIVAVVFSIPLVLLGMRTVFPGLDPGKSFSHTTLGWIEFLLATPVVVWGGWPFFFRGWQSIVNRSPNMFTLIGLGVAAAYGYSVAAVVVPGIFPASFRSAEGVVGTYFEAAAVITSLVLLGQVLELRARSRAPIQKAADVISRYFIQAVVLIAAATFLTWNWLGPEPRLVYGLVNAVAVLIIACPCALGLATPVSIMTAMGRGAAAGVLFKNAEAIEIMHKVDTLIVDKTGTLTTGKPRLVHVESADGAGERSLLHFAASLERGSEHPLAGAIVEGAREKGVPVSPAESFSSITGKGVVGKVEGHDVALGNQALLDDLHIRPSHALTGKIEELKNKGETVMAVVIDGKAEGLVGVSDPVKETAADAIRELHGEGIDIVMVTGDNSITAKAVAAALGIDYVIPEVLPEKKAEVVSQFMGQGRFVAMAGDEINDAPALARAHVGIAMGTGTDVAVKSGDVALLHGDLRGIVRARRISRETMKNIKQNVFFAFVYNALGVPIAAGVLYPFFGILLSPIIAAAVISFSSVSVIANALRLRTMRL